MAVLDKGKGEKEMKNTFLYREHTSHSLLNY